MGLDLCCGNTWVKMGSYSMVQRVRACWILAYASHLGEEELRSVVSASGREIDYERFLEIPVRDTGLFRFVVHSDADGKWTPEDASAILETLHKIRKELQIQEPFHFEDDGRYYLEGLLEKSIRTGNNIEFC